MDCIGRGTGAQADGSMRRRQRPADRSVADSAAGDPLVAAIAQPAPSIPRIERLSMLHSSGYCLVRMR